MLQHTSSEGIIIITIWYEQERMVRPVVQNSSEMCVQQNTTYKE